MGIAVIAAMMAVAAAPQEGNLLKVGTMAPDFTVNSVNGESLNLKKMLKGKKGLVVNFWFVN